MIEDYKRYHTIVVEINENLEIDHNRQLELNNKLKNIINDKLNIFTSKYSIGDLVYLKTDPDKNARIIVGILFNMNSKKPRYSIAFKENESYHYEIEFSYEKNFINY